MPAKSPFTRLCETTATPRSSGRADLHLHTTASDGQYTPAQVIDLAKRAGLAAIAITDHDTLAGFSAAAAVVPPGLDLIPAVEISAEIDASEFHLLAYFIRPDDRELSAMLAELRRHRVERFHAMTAKLRRLGLPLPDAPTADDGVALGRRQMAAMLQQAGHVASVRDAFNRYLHDGGPACVAKQCAPLADAVAVVRGAGGVACQAHPSPATDRAALTRLNSLGVAAVEVEYPGFKASRKAELRRWADELGLAITGGSDCHGPGEPRRAVGAHTITAAELGRLRAGAV